MSSSEEQVVKDLTEHFGNAVSEHPDVMSECESPK